MDSSYRHPKGLYLLFATEMWERFSYYAMRGIFVLFLTKALLFDKAFASNLYGSFTDRKPTQNNIIKLADILKLNAKDLLAQFMSKKIAYGIADEAYAGNVLKVVEQKVQYPKSHFVKN